MKSNLMNYLREYRNKSFKEHPFSEVDALLLSNLSYLKMDGILPGFERGGTIGFAELLSHPAAEHLFSDPVYGGDYRKIIALMSGSRRYGKLRFGYFTQYHDADRETQFAAVTFFLGATSIFLSFRGTDETLVGWKEDFNMAYMKSVPSQRLALAYLKGVARYVKRDLAASGKTPHFLLGGHSKGGTLALYAAANAPEAVQQYIRRIYSFDGPGMQKRFYQRAGFHRIEGRFCKIVPEQSLIGMLFSNDRSYRVVCSYRSGIVQHDLMQWKIRNGKFVYRKEVCRGSSEKSRKLNGWIESLPREQVVTFVETLYRLIKSARIETVYELMKTPVKVLHVVMRELYRLDKQSRKAFLRLFRQLLRCVRR